MRNKDEISSYIIQLTLVICIYISIFISLFFIQIGLPTESSRWAYEINQKKLDYARAIQRNKILLVAGSNTLFSLRAEIIEKLTGVKTINMGLTVALGIEYILENVKAVAKPGDTILIPLEYGHYVYNGIPIAGAVDYIFSRDPEYFYRLPISKKAQYALALKPSEILLRVVKILNPDKKVTSGGYQSATINSYGDETLNNNKKLFIQERRVQISHQSAVLLKPNFQQSQGLKVIREFSAWCKLNNVRLLATYPAFMYFPDYQNQNSKKYFNQIKSFYAELGVPILGNAYDFMYSKDKFYNSLYHLNGDAANRMTLQMVSLLKPYIQNQPKP